LLIYYSNAAESGKRQLLKKNSPAKQGCFSLFMNPIISQKKAGGMSAGAPYGNSCREACQVLLDLVQTEVR